MIARRPYLLPVLAALCWAVVPAVRPAAAQQTPAGAAPLELDGVRYVVTERSRFRVFHAPQDSLIATRVAAFLQEQPPLPGIGDSLPAGVDVVLAHSEAAFTLLRGGVVPEWSGGFAVPSRALLVVPAQGSGRMLDPEGRRTLRHEWAHIALHQASGGKRAPRWFTEGYAQWASGGFDVDDAWRLRVAMALGRTPPLDSLTLRWPAGRAQAEVAYLLAASALRYALEAGGERGLEVLLERWRSGGSFEAAFRRTFGVTTGQFEEDWRKHVRARYGWLFVLSHSSIFWLALALVLLVLVRIRQRRDREHLARLRAGEPPDEPAFWVEATEEFGGTPEGSEP